MTDDQTISGGKKGKWPLLLVMLAGGLLLGVLVWSVNEKHRLIQENKTTRPASITTEPPEVVPLPTVVPPAPNKSRVIYIDGRKGYLQTLSVWWQDTESFDSLEEDLPCATQLVPLPPTFNIRGLQ